MVTRRLRTGSGLAAAAGCALALAIPAAASAGGGQVARDFSQPVPATTQLRESPTQRAAASAAHGLEGPVLYRSAPARAPERFDLVGVAGEMRALEYRTRRAGGPWSRWVEADNGDPVYAGGADYVQLRSRGTPIAGRLHYVSLPPPPKHAPRPVAVPETAAARRGGVPEPKFVTRRQWGANKKRGGCEPRDKPDLGRVKAGVVHHTVNTNTYSQAEAPGIVLGICRFHRNGNGWDDIGYNALVDRFGTLYQGRAGGMSRAVIGAQAEGINTYTTGIASIGDYTSAKPSRDTVRGIIRYLAWKFDVVGLEALGRTRLLSGGGETQRTPKGKRVKVPMIFSHNYTNFTGCAGAKLIRQIPKIRRAVQKRLDKFGGGGTEPSGQGTGGGLG
jgi:hypothetical protein